MILAFGKFDPDLNPVPFQQWSRHFAAAEIELPQYFAWKPRVRQYLRSWTLKHEIRLIPRVSIRTQREQAEYEEWVSLWNEEWGPQTLYWSLYSGRRAWDEDLAALQIQRFEKAKQDYWVEWGQLDRLATTRFFESRPNFKGIVVDPGWHSFRGFSAGIKNNAIRFKLHGWHEARWMRRYGEAQATKITKLCHKYSESPTLVLSYSGKVDEAGLFKIMAKSL
jgi:hypothetical protein